MIALRADQVCARRVTRKTRNMMPKSSADRRRALELLARCTDGCTEAVLLAHGFTTKLITELVRTGLATT